MNTKIQTFIIVLIFTNNFITGMQQQEQVSAVPPAPLHHSIQRQPSKTAVTIDAASTTVAVADPSPSTIEHTLPRMRPTMESLCPNMDTPRTWAYLFAAAVLTYVVLTFVPLPH